MLWESKNENRANQAFFTQKEKNPMHCFEFVQLYKLLFRNGPFGASGHMVQNPPCWRASDALGHPKQRKRKFVLMKSLCSGCPSGQLALQHGGFCTM